MAGNPHAKIAAEYAKRMETEMEPWRDLDHQVPGFAEWFKCSCTPDWVPGWKYRWRPKTIKIGDMDVPAPETEAPDVGTAYFCPSLDVGGLVWRMWWKGDHDDLFRLARRIVHLPAEHAIIHAKALIAVSGGKVGDE